MMDKGVIYVATGERYINETLKSASSLKEHMPNIHVTLFTDQNVKSSYIDNVISISNPQGNFGDKILPLINSPYNKTLYLDTDTFICDDISELFLILERFDIAVCHSPVRESIHFEDIPDSFTEFNSGVILFKQSSQIKELFSEWNQLYQKSSESLNVSNLPDQPYLRKVLYYNDKLRIATLPFEYNCRFPMGGYVHKKVKILHGRHPNLNEIARIINSKVGGRVFVYQKGIFKVLLKFGKRIFFYQKGLSKVFYQKGKFKIFSQS